MTRFLLSLICLCCLTPLRASVELPYEIPFAKAQAVFRDEFLVVALIDFKEAIEPGAPLLIIHKSSHSILARGRLQRIHPNRKLGFIRLLGDTDPVFLQSIVDEGHAIAKASRVRPYADKFQQADGTSTITKKAFHGSAVRVSNGSRLMISLGGDTGSLSPGQTLLIVSHDKQTILAKAEIERINDRRSAAIVIVNGDLGAHLLQNFAQEKNPIIQESQFQGKNTDQLSPLIEPLIVAEQPAEASASTSQIADQEPQNPLLGLQLKTLSLQSPSLNYVTGGDFSPEMASIQNRLLIFIPTIAKRRWINSFGLALDYHSTQESKLRIRRSNEEQAQITSLVQATFEVSVIYQKLQNSRWISSWALVLTPYSLNDERLELTETAVDPGGIYQIKREQMRVGLEFESRPFWRLLLAASLQSSFNSIIKIENGLDKLETGLSQQRAEISIGYRQAIGQYLSWQASLGGYMLSEKLEANEALATPSTSTSRSRSLLFQLGLSYHP